MLTTSCAGDNPESSSQSVAEKEEFVYDYGFEESVMPFWLSDVIYNEPILLLDDGDGKAAHGRLMCDAEEIYSVRDYSQKREWVRGVDWDFVDGEVVRVGNSDIPFFTSENMRGRDLYRRSYGENGEIVRTPFDASTPYFQTVSGEDTVIYTETPLIFEYQIFVTYRYKKGAYRGPVQQYLGDGLPLLENKIRKGEKIKMLLLGDSLSCGGSSSSNLKCEPYLKNWYELFADAVSKASGAEESARRMDAYLSAYKAFILKITSTYGRDVPIFCCYGTMGEANIYVPLENTLYDEFQDRGYPNVYPIKLSDGSLNGEKALHGHPNYLTHCESAEILAKAIAENTKFKMTGGKL